MKFINVPACVLASIVVAACVAHPTRDIPPETLDNYWSIERRGEMTWPSHSMSVGQSGCTLVQFEVSPGGSARKITVLKQYPADGLYEDAGKEFMRTFRFSPTPQNGSRSSVRTTRLLKWEAPFGGEQGESLAARCAP